MRHAATAARAARVAHAAALASLVPLATAFAQGTPPPGSPGLPPMASPAPETHFAVRGFEVVGDNPLPPAETQALLAPWVRPDATLHDLQQAAAALERAMRARGFGLYRVVLPPQAVGEHVRLEVLRFSVGQVRVQGASAQGEAEVRAALPALREGGSPDLRALAVQTALANENPNRQLQVGLKESDRPDRIDATVTVRELQPWTLSAGLANSGTRETGRDRASLSAGTTRLFGLDQQASLAYTTSLQRPGDVRQFGLSWRAPLYALGAAVSLNATRSDVVGNFGSFTSTGAGHTLGLQLTKYLPPEGGHRAYLTLGLDDKVFQAALVSGVAVGVDRRSRPVTLGYAVRLESDAAVLAWNLDVSTNLASGAGNTLAAWRQEDPRVDTVHVRVLRGAATWSIPLAGWQATLRGQFQASPEVLISGEQFGLGGQGSVRGTAIERPLTGDLGVSGSAELATPGWAPGLRAIGFADAGWLGNHRPDGGARPASDRLASVGLGLRYDRDPWAVGADLGRLVTGSRVPLRFNSAAPQRGDQRFYVNLAVKF